MNTYIGVDYHKHYSVASAINQQGQRLAEVRIDGNTAAGFKHFFSQLPGALHVVFEACWNWHKLYEIFEEIPVIKTIQLADPFRTHLIAKSQIKTDKIDARKLAELRRGNFIHQAHIPSREARMRKEVMRQRIFWVKQRTRLRNRVHKLVDGQRDLDLPQVSDLFGRKGIAALKKAPLSAHTRMLLDQDLEVHEVLNVQIRAIEKQIRNETKNDSTLRNLQSVPGIGITLSAVIASEVDIIDRFISSNQFCSYSGLVPSTHASGGKYFHGPMLRWSNKWLKWAFVEAAWVAVGCDPYFGALYKYHRHRGQGANISISIVARRLAKIVWSVLKENRPYRKQSFVTPLMPARL